MGASRITVAVGTSNPLKLRAARLVFSRYFDALVVPVSVDSGVGPQPSGVRDVFRGALNRAVRALKKVDADFGVGVEAGPIELPSSTGFLETQVAVIVDRECRASVGLSPSFELDESVMRAVLAGVELERAVGVERRVPIGEGIGYVGVATRGLITRQELTAQAIAMALIPWLEGYKSIGSVSSLASQLGVEDECTGYRG
jgi:inosine/xanthosine triphosphatase